MTISPAELALCAVRSSRGTATGFAFLRAEWYATARHALGEPPDPVSLELAGGRRLSACVAFRHPRVDLAIVALEAPGPCQAPLCPAQDPPASGRLLCLCWKEADPGDAKAGAVLAIDAFERTARRRDGDEETLYMFPAPAGEPVRSGSPLVTPAGLVVAVVIDGIRLDGVEYLRATSITPLLGPLEALVRTRRTAPATPRSE